MKLNQYVYVHLYDGGCEQKRFWKVSWKRIGTNSSTLLRTSSNHHVFIAIPSVMHSIISVSTLID